jgi:hypothetical protein
MPGFLIGIVVGALAASTYLKKKGGASSLTSAMSSGSSRGTGASEGRVDELSSAANMSNPETAPFNAGDGTPSGMSRPTASQTPPTGLSSGTGLSESRH